MNETNELLKVVEVSGVEASTATTLKEKFMPFFQSAEEWKKKAESIIVTDSSQIHEMKLARNVRLALREIRINADKTRKELKEDSIRYGKAVQGMYNVIEYLIVPIEKYLQAQEDFAIIEEAKRKAELKANRELEIALYKEFVPAGLDFGELSEDDFEKTLNGAKLQHKEKLELEAKLEAERIAKEKAEIEERKRIEAENEKLKIEAEKREKELAIEREKAKKAKFEADEKIRKEKEEKEKIEAELKVKILAEEKAKKEAQDKILAEEKAKKEAERKAKLAPDKEKLTNLANLIQSIEMPDVKSDEAKNVIKDVNILLEKVCKFINDKSKNL